jgi:cobalt-zinc-cadmium efflux system outer membrane protein
VDLENIGGDLDSDRYEATATLGQTLELGGDRRARSDAALAVEQLSSWELSVEEREVLSHVTERFLETWALQERVARLADAERLAERSITAATDRFRAGAGPAFEQSRAEGVLALRRAERIRASAELTSSWQRLVASWGSIEVRFDSLRLDAPRRVTLPPPVRLDSLLEAHPQRRRIAAEVALEHARLREARAARVPDLDLAGGVRRLAAEDATTFIVGASIPIPVWNRHAGSTAAAEAEHRAATAREHLVALDLRAALRDAYERYVAAHASYELIATEVTPKSEDVLRQVAAGYRSGRFSSLELLEGQRSLLEAELQLIDATAEVWRARAALERRLGRSIESLGEEGQR